METSGMQMKRSDRVCSECGASIPPERLRLLPDTFTCVKCSTEQPRTDVPVDGADQADSIHSSQSATWDPSGHR